ncbi:SagB/ThcOx family dehydrogenase [Amycolatopsis minnesotensis]|uniref:Nitroreductase domain-containing protein n=1 Tax=Amycolatopsis minnesotensis TaxID=337894 RepID=A0ABP5DEB9_9PSEU
MTALADLLARRRSRRDFAATPLGLDELTGLLWAAQGSTGDGHRTSPSAHARHPLSVCAVTGHTGIQWYETETGALRPGDPRDHRDAVARASLADEAWLGTAPALLVLGGDLAAARAAFAEQPPAGVRGERYLWLEAGHASQNVYLWATAKGLGAVLVAGFDDERLRALPVVPDGHDPLAILAVGHPANP